MIDADIEGAVQVLLRSFAGHENARLGPSYVRALLRAFASAPRSLELIREQNGVVGFAAGEPADERAARFQALRLAAAGAFLRRPWLLFDPAIAGMARARLQGGAGERVPAGTWFLAVIGVDPQFHGRGLGGLLLRAFEEAGRRRGFSRGSLLVAEGNVAARRLYERGGWTQGDAIGGGRLLYVRTL